MQLSVLSKAELHCHLDGSLRLATLQELTRAAGLTLPGDLKLGQEHPSLVEYLLIFESTVAVLQTKETLQRASFELAEDVAADGVRHLELRFCPALHVRHGLSMEQVLDAVLSGLQRGQRQTGLSTGVIVCCLRDLSPRVSEELAELACEFMKKGVVGLDLAGPERGFPASAHRAAFERAGRAGLHRTVHAGEAAGPESIEDALALSPDRLGHATRLGEDPALLARVKALGISLEACLSSNVQTRAVGSLKAHPVKDYLRAGLCVTLCTDNRLVSHTSLSREYELAHEECGLSLDELRQLARNGIRAAFIDDSMKEKLLDETSA
jgi:adenosine deaminase